MNTVTTAVRRMALDVFRDGDHYVLTADLPGVDPASIDVDVDGRVLTIRAERSVRGADGVDWITRERAGGTFLRRLQIGSGIDAPSITANYDNGVLSVVLPVSEAAKPRKVAVQGAPSVAPTTDQDAPVEG